MADHSWKIDGGTDEQFAWIESGEGHNIACVERVAGTNHDRSRVKFAGGSVTLMSEREIMQHATTDEQWQSMTDLIAAAPEMLALLTRMEFVLFDDKGEREEWLRQARAALAKAEPKRTVRRRLNVVVAIEVEAPSDTHLDAIKNHALESVHHTGGTLGDCTVKFVSQAVTTVGELYEE
jgi:hypothetical protein